MKFNVFSQIINNTNVYIIIDLDVFDLDRNMKRSTASFIVNLGYLGLLFLGMMKDNRVCQLTAGNAWLKNNIYQY